MGFPTVDRFCCCCSLETGGLIVGWFNIIVSFLGILGSIFMILFGSSFLFYVQDLDGPGVGVATAIGITFIVIGAIYLIFLLIYFIAGILLVSAVKNRDHERMRLILILMVISVILSFVSIATSLLGGLLVAIIYSAITCYFFLCIYSLYVKLKDESRSGGVHMQPSPYA